VYLVEAILCIATYVPVKVSTCTKVPVGICIFDNCLSQFQDSYLNVKFKDNCTVKLSPQFHRLVLILANYR